MDYKDTLNLPRTDFAMKADLVTREPERLKKWEAANLYTKIQEARKDEEKFVLHDGPPFANGDVHIGTALNKILKDIIVKYKTLRGYSAPFVPGWDCHGLPIEFKVSQDLRKAGDTSADAATIRKACEAYARKYIDIQRTQFKRLGVLGDWEDPYLTLNKEYEADELRLFANIVEQGFVYRGKKPVYWSIPCRTALAEAEVEYHDHVSQSVFVKFPVLGKEKTFVLIWTTTPWTLPANLAVAYNKDFQYVNVRVGEENYILFSGLLPKVAEKCGWSTYDQNPVSREELEKLQYQHPFCNRTGRAFAAEFVTSDMGTGFIHIAPGHGLDDYNLGRQNGLPIYSPVDDDGKFALTNDLPVEQQMPLEMVGKSILEKHGKSDANEAVLHELRLRHAMLHQENYHHSYPYCWRSKTPIIFRAMDQWFVAMDIVRGQNNISTGNVPGVKDPLLDFHPQSLRGEAVKAVTTDELSKKIEWVPLWGRNRILGAIQTRPDWCISRQRTWGVPIPAFYDAKGEPILDAQIVRNTAGLIEQHGSNVWFEKTASELWTLVKPQDWKGAEAVAKSNDTLDVWIDSGSSSRSVLMQRKELLHTVAQASSLRVHEASPSREPGGETPPLPAGGTPALPWQADMYLEGSDQHRGWFQSSLLLSLAGNGAAPYKTVLTHGFMVDADREKISKSKQTPPEFVGNEEGHSCFFAIKQASLQSFREFLNERGFQVIREEEAYEVNDVKYIALYPNRNDISDDEAKKIIAEFTEKPKSGYEKPQTSDAYVKKWGADVVRLWVASQDFRDDIIVSEERIGKVAETYRGIRNALRYQLSNLYDFNPETQTVADDKLTGLDRWILSEFSKLEQEVVEAYDKYEFHVVYQKISQFVSVELSSIYHDVIKDRLYTDAANSHRRRSTQTTLHRLVKGLCQMLAPILAFTTEEAWEFSPGKGAESVHSSEWQCSNFSTAPHEAGLWRAWFEERDLALLELEKARQGKKIGKSLEAKLILKRGKGLIPAITAQKDPEPLRELLNVSQLTIELLEPTAPNVYSSSIDVVLASGQKCERCWHWETDVGSNPEHPTICARCVEAVKQSKA